jgi:uncharacterized protein GlcG (DUF336 family)
MVDRLSRAWMIPVLLVGLSSPVLAQAPSAPPAAPGPAGVAPPKPLTPETEIPFGQALDAARTALEACAAINSAAVVGVVDLNGHYKVLLRADKTGFPFYDFMRRKAYTVLKKNMASGDYGKLPQNVGVPRGTVLEGDPNLITFPGAVPIMKGGTMIGVLSVSGPTGGDNDMKCTNAGLAKFHL